MRALFTHIWSPALRRSTGTSLALLMGVLASSVALAQDALPVTEAVPSPALEPGGTDKPSLDGPIDSLDAEATRAALSREIAQIRADIADVERFRRWQERLMRMARTDREEALRQRLPMAECRSSVLAPICDELTGTFKPEATEETGEVSP